MQTRRLVAHVPPTGILPGQAQHQSPYRAHGPQSARPLGPEPGSVPAGDQIAMPAQDRIWAYQQPQPSQPLHRQPVQQRCQECPVNRGEPHFLLAQLTLQHRDLMAQGEDLRIFVAVAHRQQAQYGERVRRGQVGESQQHDRTSCRSDRQAREGATSIRSRAARPDPRTRPTRPD
jgi:hypothetical protein